MKENFEGYAVGNVGNGTGDPGFVTAVGTFKTMGGTGTGGTVTDPTPDLDGTKLAIRDGQRLWPFEHDGPPCRAERQVAMTASWTGSSTATTRSGSAGW